MLRLTDIKLPLDHGPEALKAAILKKLKLPADAACWTGTSSSAAMTPATATPSSYIYTVDVQLKDESRAAEDHQAHARHGLSPGGAGAGVVSSAPW